MKRFFALVALVLGLASCQTEPEGLDVQMGGAVDATITVNIPNSETRYGSDSNSAGSAFHNRIIADADYTVRYILQVFNEDGSASKDMMYKYSDDDTVAFDVHLVPGRDYRFVVWADIVEKNAQGEWTALHYVIGETLQDITLAEPVVDGDDKWAAMDETRDAYTGIYDSVEFSAAENITLTLKRPFAKLRIITTDMNELFGGVSPHNAVVTYTTPHYNAFNAFSGVASGERTGETHTYTIADYADFVGTDYEDTNKVLFTDYFFANESGVVKFTMDVMEADGQSIKYNTFNTDIAVKRNHLTTIEGNILTDGNKVNVTVEDTFGENNKQHIDYKTISSDNEFLTAVETPGKYVVISDLHIAKEGTTVNNGQASTYATRSGATTTIDLNGKKITVDNKSTGALASVAAGNTLVITNTVDGGKIELTEGSKGAFIENNGIVVIENGNIESESTNDAPVIENKGTTNITGGVIGDNAVENNETEGGSVNITGGTFESDPSEFVDSDYNVVENEDGSYEIEIKDVIAKIGEVEYRTLQKAFDAADGETTIELIADFTLEESTVIAEGKNITLKLNEKTITGTSAKGAGAIIENNGTLTILGGTIKNTYTNGDAVINNTGELVLNGVKINGAPIGETGYPNYAVYTSGTLVVENETEIISDRGVINLMDGADVTINGGNFAVTDAVGTRTLTAHAIYAYGYSSKLTINGGHFEMNIANGGGTSVICPAGATIKVYGGNFYHVPVDDVQSGCFQNYMGYGAPVDVYRGTFNDDTVTKSGNIAEGSEVTESNGIWTVSIIPVAQIGATEYDTLQEAFNVGGNITLLRNVTVAETVTLAEGKVAILNLNGKTITGNWHKDNGAVIKNNGTLTIVGGTISSTGENGGSAIQNTGELTVKAATLNGAPNANGSWPSYAVNNTGTMTAENTTITSYHGAVASYGDGAVVTLNNCTIDMAGIPGFTNHGIYTYNNGKVVVNGGAYENKATDQNSTGASVINGAVEVNAGTFSGRIENYYGTPVLKGGTFNVKPNNNFIATGYKAVQSGDKYMVVKEDVGGVATDNATLDTAIKNAQDGDTIALNAGEYAIPDSAVGKTITFVGTGAPEDTLITAQNDGAAEGNCDYSLRGSKATFENVTITTTGTYFPGYAGCQGTYKNCIINGVFTLYDSSSFEDCTFNISGDLYNVWTWGAAEATFTNCTFNCDGKAMLLYGQANTKLTMNNCVFNDNGDDTVTGKAAIEIGNDYNKSYELTVNNATVNGFAINPNGFVTGTTLWANKNSMGQDKLNVVVDGVDVY